MIVNIYGLLEPGTTIVRYIGKTIQKAGETAQDSMARRLRGHMTPWNIKSERHTARWIRKLQRRGLCPDFMLIDIGDEHTWADLETFHIKSHRQVGFKLTNMTDGGEGCNGFHHTQAHKEYIGGLMKGRVHAPETIAKMSASKKGKPSKRRGIPLPEEQRRRLTGLKRTPAQRARMSIARRKSGHKSGGEFAPGHKTWNKGIPRTAEERARMSAAHKALYENGYVNPMTGRAHTEETKAVQSALRKQYYQAHPITHCQHGHEFTEENTIMRSDGTRTCRTCQKQCAAEHRERVRNGEPKRASPETIAILSQKATERWASKPRTHCKNGHPITPESSYYTPSDLRSCRICKQNRSKAAWERRKAARAAAEP